MATPRDRKEKALDRLKQQLVDGTKTEKKSTNKVPLLDQDKKRIDKEIEILQKKIG